MENTRNQPAMAENFDLRDGIGGGGQAFSMGPLIEQVTQSVRNNRWLILAIIAASLIIGVVTTLLETKIYRSTARIEISRVDNSVVDVEGVTVDERLRDQQYYFTQYQVLRARSLAERVVRGMNLSQNERFLETFGLTSLPEDNPERMLASVLLANIDITPVERSSLVDISFASPDKQVSMQVANAWAEQYIEANLDRRFASTVDARQFLEERLTELRARLEEAERELIEYGAANNLFTIEAPSTGGSGETAAQTLVASDLQALNAALAEATADRISAQSALIAPGASLEQQDLGVLAQLRGQRAVLVTQRAELRTRFADEYPPIRALSAQIAQLDGEISREQNRAESSVGDRYQQALSRERQLQSRVNQLRAEFQDQRSRSVQYNILQREVDTNRELYNGLLQRYREIGVADVGENNVSIVDRAVLPGGPWSPSLTQNLLLSLFIGFLAASVVVFLREQLNQSLRDPREVSERLGLPVVASIPKSNEDDLVEEINTPYTGIYESYFSALGTIAALNRGTLPKSIMITSSRPGEGKSSSAIALASIAARQEKKVLLLDADIRNSVLRSYLSLESSMGLSQVLRGEAGWRDVLLQAPDMNNFDIIAAGRNSQSAAELLSGSRFSTLLDEVEKEYDFIVIDGPPVLGLADAPLIANLVNAVLLAVEANVGKWRFIENALMRLQQSRANMLGVLVTKVDERNSSYGYGEGYGYGYGYGRKGGDEEGVVPPVARPAEG